MNVGASTPDLARKLRWQVRYIERVVDAHGTESEKREVREAPRPVRALLRVRQHPRAQVDRRPDLDDPRGRRSQSGLVLAERARHPERARPAFLNRERAAALIQEAADANTRGDLPALRSACNRAWALQPPDQLAAANEQAAETGLRGT